MFTCHSPRCLLGLAGLLSITVALGSVTAEARPGDRTQRPHTHGDWTSHSERQRTENGHTSHTTWTGSNGRTGTRDATVVNDRDTQTRTRDVAYTGPAGKQASVHDVTQKIDDGHTRTTTFTDSQGRTAAREATVVNDKEAGTRTRDVTYTGRDGQTRTVQDITQKTDSGYTRNSTFTNAQGDTATRNAIVTNDKDNGVRTRDVTYTGVNGRTATSNTVATRTDDGYTRNTTVIGPKGGSGTREVVVACDRSAGHCTKDVAVSSNSK